VTTAAVDAHAPQELIAAATRRIVRRARRERAWSRRIVAVGGGIVAVVVLLSVVRPWLGLPDPQHQDFAHVASAPSWSHLFGTDSLGRDMFSRTIAASQLDLSVALALTATSLAIGLLAGALAGFFGGIIDTLIMRVADVCLAFPFIVLVLVIIAITGPGLTGVFIGVPLSGWALYARLTRAAMLGVREREWVLASRTLGFPVRRTFARHALPHVWRPAVTFSMADFVLNITVLATLSYLGVGAQPPQPEWGALIADGQSQLLNAWWISTLPGLFVALVGVSVTLLGDGLAEILGTDGRLVA
jgi:peptide/nickel transport system permease protein